MSDDGFVKVRFHLPAIDEDWPPATTEGLWAQPVPDGYELHNTPFFVRGCALRDVVSATPDRDGVLWAGDVVRRSGNCTVRVIVWPTGPLEGDLRATAAKLEPHGAAGEGLEQFDLLSFNVPPDADLPAIRRVLDEGVADGSWDYEEGSVTPEWRAAL